MVWYFFTLARLHEVCTPSPLAFSSWPSATDLKSCAHECPPRFPQLDRKLFEVSNLPFLVRLLNLLFPVLMIEPVNAKCNSLNLPGREQSPSNVLGMSWLYLSRRMTQTFFRYSVFLWIGCSYRFCNRLMQLCRIQQASTAQKVPSLASR